MGAHYVSMHSDHTNVSVISKGERYGGDRISGEVGVWFFNIDDDNFLLQGDRAEVIRILERALEGVRDFVPGPKITAEVEHEGFVLTCWSLPNEDEDEDEDVEPGDAFTIYANRIGEDEIIGHIDIVVDGPWVNVMGIEVKPEHRRQGVGRALVTGLRLFVQYAFLESRRFTDEGRAFNAAIGSPIDEA